jgi:hypothetical protein
MVGACELDSSDPAYGRAEDSFELDNKKSLGSMKGEKSFDQLSDY